MSTRQRNTPQPAPEPPAEKEADFVPVPGDPPAKPTVQGDPRGVPMENFPHLRRIDYT